MKLNARECFHLFKLRIQRQAHFTIQQVSEAALKLAVEAHPWLFRHSGAAGLPQLVAVFAAESSLTTSL